MGRAFGCEGTDGNGDRVALGVRRGIACGGGRGPDRLRLDGVSPYRCFLRSMSCG